MIAGFFPAANVTLYACSDEHLSSGSVEQEMVDPYAGIASIGISEIVPERKDRLVRVEFPDGISPALRKKLLVSRHRLRKKSAHHRPGAPAYMHPAR